MIDSDEHETDTEIDPRELRHVMGHFATGVVAITATDGETGSPVGLAANSFTSVSLAPPLVAFCVAKTSSSWPRVKASRRFVVNILSDAQEGVCRSLAMKGGDKFAGLSWLPSPAGAPVLEGGLAWMEVELDAEHDAGDHVIVVSRVHHIHAGELEPLIFYRGKYGRIEPFPVEVDSSIVSEVKR
ncbi:flavin reductase family protein [Gordonia terrae]|uniref:Flavin reductase n=2 Tax=Gordonia terrae TaxID=2055 RepID=A0AAD0NW92_9ACTN|nr:flavin reductase family protein [Gordonia terrae]VTR09624.1 Flavin-dependent monooxygenase, reductase subunit HsaB [Clostridioides difficile]ANY22233.1 monooxygenase [Gordonia terrae]AWO82972.1 flavin reductase [Gordonia terrae]VTS30227.1 Flavin-dependent monooxygenase, reductase subunit HsaB [Gordonia terrae]GAB46296.1 putative oxidoreductase [Gordonia terrae NBRC 100016]